MDLFQEINSSNCIFTMLIIFTKHFLRKPCQSSINNHNSNYHDIFDIYGNEGLLTQPRSTQEFHIETQ